MGVPTSAVGYTATMPWREDHEVHKGMWWGHWTEKKSFLRLILCPASNSDTTIYTALLSTGKTAQNALT